MPYDHNLLNYIFQVLNDFNNFWYTHHLFAFFYILLLLHPQPGLPDERHEWGVSDAWVWAGKQASKLAHHMMPNRHSYDRENKEIVDFLP